MSVVGDATIVAVRGEADVATVEVLVDALALAIAIQPGPLVVDLAEALFVDTATMRVVTRAADLLRGQGRRLTVRSPSLLARWMLALVGLTALIEPEPRRARAG
jgi:anti-anti-sigma factor